MTGFNFFNNDMDNPLPSLKELLKYSIFQTHFHHEHEIFEPNKYESHSEDCIIFKNLITVLYI